MVGHSDREARRLVPRDLEEKTSGQRVIVVLEKASLELVQVRAVWMTISTTRLFHLLFRFFDYQRISSFFNLTQNRSIKIRHVKVTSLRLVSEMCSFSALDLK